jgi:predicted Zn finger-like uncharacterized protein
MIVACTCGAKLKVSEERIGAHGVKIKCPRCATVQLVGRPEPDFEETSKAELSVPAKPPDIEEPSGHPSAMPWFAPASSVTPAPQRTLVLVAHDTKVVADMIEGILKKSGMIMAYARNGLEALKKATSLRPQAMVVDVGLTGIFGFELCERLKSDPDTAGIKIILLSSVYGLTAYKREPVTLYGADDYIEKHHIPDELVPKLQKLLSPEPPVVEKRAPSQQEPEPDVTPISSTGSSGPTVPLISRKGIIQAPASRMDTDEPILEQSLEQEGATGPSTGRGEGIEEFVEYPWDIPDTPAVRDPGWKTPEVSSVIERSAPTAEKPSEETALQDAPPVPGTSEPAAGTVSSYAQRQKGTGDESAGMMAEFFERQEYVEPSKDHAFAAVDPQEIDKARRFARLIVSDIVLYNEDSVAEGIRQGTFYELLQDDIREGRSLYEKRVPETIRATKDYLQEAFDNFLASKKKPR